MGKTALLGARAAGGVAAGFAAGAGRRGRRGSGCRGGRIGPAFLLAEVVPLRPLSVPLVFASLYLALHSFIVSAWTGDGVTAPASTATAQIATVA